MGKYTKTHSLHKTENPARVLEEISMITAAVIRNTKPPTNVNDEGLAWETCHRTNYTISAVKVLQ